MRTEFELMRDTLAWLKYQDYKDKEADKVKLTNALATCSECLKKEGECFNCGLSDKTK